MNAILKTLALTGLALSIAVTGSQAAVLVAKPPKPAPVESTREGCGADIGWLRDIRPGEVMGFEGQRVTIRPICEDLAMSMDVDEESLFSAGNVRGMRKMVGENPVFALALAERDYDYDDVIAVRFNNADSAILYVHKR